MTLRPVMMHVPACICARSVRMRLEHVEECPAHPSKGGPYRIHCANCKHWSHTRESEGECGAVQKTSGPAWIDTDDQFVGALLVTEPDFSCALFEKKP